jgi:hypothetical protein
VPTTQPAVVLTPCSSSLSGCDTCSRVHYERKARAVYVRHVAAVHVQIWFHPLLNGIGRKVLSRVVHSEMRQLLRVQTACDGARVSVFIPSALHHSALHRTTPCVSQTSARYYPSAPSRLCLHVLTSVHGESKRSVASSIPARVRAACTCSSTLRIMSPVSSSRFSRDRQTSRIARACR